jgi:anti-sigma factor RsiW
MNKELQLRLQAYLDSEVSSSEARQVAALLSKDAEAQALYEELRQTKTLLAGNELEIKLPESREFYWSKIQREISRVPADERSPARPQRAWWFRLLAPLSATAIVALGMIALTSHQTSPGFLSRQEVETALEDTSAISFFSDQHKMTVVWVQSQID